MCHNELHVVIDCAPVPLGQPDVCDLVSEFLKTLQESDHTTLNFELQQIEDVRSG